MDSLRNALIELSNFENCDTKLPNGPGNLFALFAKLPLTVRLFLMYDCSFVWDYYLKEANTILENAGFYLLRELYNIH